jgi:MFS family permease
VDGEAEPAPRRPADADERPGFRDVLRVRTFLALYGAETQSVIGDQLARVALSVLIYRQTGSTAETALTYALTFLPAIAGGTLLSGLADRYSRRWVMIGCDILRCALLAAMALPGLPVGVLFALLVLAVFLGPAFTSAEVSLIADILDGERYRVATGLRMMTNQVAQVAGFAVGGAVVAMLHPHWALALDAATYALSAGVIALAVRAPAPRGAAASASDGRARDADQGSFAACMRGLFGNAHLRALVVLSWLAAFFVVPEGLAAPYAHAIGDTPGTVGYLLAAIPFGSVAGAYIVLRALPPRLRTRALGPLALLAGIPLLGCAFEPAVGWSMLLWFASGVFSAYQLDVMTRIVNLTPPERRGRVVGVLGASLLGAQGVGLILFGVIADVLSAGPTIALAGATGSLCAAGAWFALARSTRAATAPVAAGLAHSPRW